MSKQILDHFGELLIKRVRDKAIGEWESIILGQMKGLRAERVSQHLRSFAPEQREKLISLVPQIVDSVLHHLLWTIEQEASVDVLAKAGEDRKLQSVRDASDGLPGELYGDFGWIARFSSKQKSAL